MRRFSVSVGALAAIGFAATSTPAASIVWNNGGIGNGTTWDTVQLNWNTGTVAFTSGDDVAFSDANNGNYAISVPASVSVSSLTATNTASPYVFTIATGQTLTSTGNVSIGQTTANTDTLVTLTGGGSFSQTGGNLALSLTNALANPAPQGNIDAAGLATFSYVNVTGQVQIGVGTRTSGHLTLANAAGSVNTLTAAQIRVGDSGSGNAGSIASSITLGGGSNALNADVFTLGNGKAAGSILATAGGTVTISGTAGGASNAAITIGRGSSGTATSTLSQLALAGANATVQASTVIVGQLNGATGTQPNGGVTFDTGNFTVATSLQIASDLTGADTAGVKGAFTLGTDSASTGVLDVSGTFLIGNVATGSNAAVKTDSATFTMNGGTANVHTDINSFNGKSATTTVSSTLSLLGGTLNMNGNQIGHASGNNIAITTVNMPTSGKTATLANLGGAGINDAGVTMNGAGTLVLAGNNTYTGNTTVNSGVLTLSSSTSNNNIANSPKIIVGNSQANSAAVLDVTGITAAGGFRLGSAQTLGGFGTVKGAATLASGSVLSPGNSIGTLTLDGTGIAAPLLTFASGATILDELDNVLLGDSVALIHGSAGDIAFNNTVVNFSDLSGGSLGAGQYTLFSADVPSAYTGLTTDGSGNITGGLSIGSGLTNYTASLQVLGSNIVVNVAPVPEPATFALAACGALVIALIRLPRAGACKLAYAS